MTPRPTQHAIRDWWGMWGPHPEPTKVWRSFPPKHAWDALDAAIRADERERCAQECRGIAAKAEHGHYGHQGEGVYIGAEDCAARIRALAPEPTTPETTTWARSSQKSRFAASSVSIPRFGGRMALTY